MAQDFHLKLITQRAGGGDPIIRERVVAGPELSIGRGADSDIVLADLSIDLKHARVRLAGPGRVSIESVGGQPFQVGGKSVQRADLNAASGPVARFGSYSLTFSAAEEDGVAITVTRDDDEHHLSPSVFSLQARVFNRRNMSWALGGTIALVCLLVPLLLTLTFAHPKIHPDQQWSSGPLSRSHAFLEGDCRSCHANAFVAVKDETCLSCHAAGVGAQKAVARARDLRSPFEPRLAAMHAAHDKLEQATPLPAGFGAKVSTVVQRALGHPTDRCASCHVEHTPTPAGPDPKAPLSDKPKLVTVQNCQSCHAGLKSRLTKTELTDTPDWGRHPTFRAQIMTQAGPHPTFARVELKAMPQERNGLIFPHKMHLDPLGGVARQAIALGKGAGYGAALECASCHRRDGNGKDFKPIEMERDCGGCHSLAYARGADGRLLNLPHGELQKVVDTLSGRALPSAPGADRHRPGMIRLAAFSATGAGAYRATFAPGGACHDCHTISWEGDTVRMAPVKLTARYLPRGAFDHAVPEHGGPGQGKAGSFKCADCHKAQTSERSGDVLIPDLAKCATCHGQPTTKTAAAADAECTSCHAFHAPGEATPKPGHPPLELMRWTKVASR